LKCQWISGIAARGSRAPGPPHGHGHQRHPESKIALGTGSAGRFLVIAVELLGIRSLSSAVARISCIGTTLAIFTGGVVRWMVDAALKKSGGAADAEGDVSPGSLYASGLIAAGRASSGLLGVGLQTLRTPSARKTPSPFRTASSP